MSSNESQVDGVIADETESAEANIFTFVSDRPLTALALAIVFGAFLAHRVFRRRAHVAAEL